MRYEQAIAKLFALASRGIRLGVRRMDAALAYRGAPHTNMSCIQVGGTNGKGSVASMVASVLTQAGYRTGLYTSPHLHRWVERIAINGRPMSEREAAQRISDVLTDFAKPSAPETTFFELTTLIAIEAFRDHGCDIVVLEVGLGGRLDATSAITPLACAITRVALDHMNLLGDTLPKIAREKAGILKPAVPVVVGVREPSARRVILDRAHRIGAPVCLVDRDYSFEPEPRGRFCARVGDRRFPGLQVRLRGTHQLENGACAVALLHQLESYSHFRALDALATGLSKTAWPGRMEHLATRPLIVADAAHNLDGCIALAEHVSRLRHKGPRILIFGCMRDKDFRPMLRTLGPHFDQIIYFPPHMPRAATFSMLNRIKNGLRAASAGAALTQAKALAGSDGLVVIAGSIFLVAELRAELLGIRSDPSIRM